MARPVAAHPRTIAMLPRRIGRSAAFGAAAFAAREVVATMRVGLAAGRGWRGAHHAAEEPAEDVMVLVHGMLATAGRYDGGAYLVAAPALFISCVVFAWRSGRGSGARSARLPGVQ